MIAYVTDIGSQNLSRPSGSEIDVGQGTCRFWVAKGWLALEQPGGGCESESLAPIEEVCKTDVPEMFDMGDVDDGPDT